MMEVKKVLIIDDEKSFCNLVKMNLDLVGRFEVHIANNGKDGVKLAKKIQPDVILLDVIMPRQSGFKTLEVLKKDLKTISIPVIMLSALTDEKSVMRAGSMYSEHYVTKPISTEKLIEKIDWTLNIGKK